MVYTNKPISAEQSSPAQMKMIELFEDTRVEYPAIRDFPGLRKLWLRFFTAPMTPGDEYLNLYPRMETMVRLATALLDPGYLLVLMDLSEFTNQKVGVKESEPGYDEAPRILGLTLESTGLLAWAIDFIGDNFAVYGFASDGRHDVQYYRFKDFDQSYNEVAKS